MTRLIALYPRPWRDRYEDEFIALLADRPPDPLGKLDIVRGALDARIHPQVDPSLEPIGDPPGPWRARAGWSTLLGGVLWITAMVVAANGPLVVDGGHTYRDGTAAFPLWALAVVLLGAGMIGVVLDLPASARAARGSAYVAALTGLLWALAPWILIAGLAAFIGLAIVAVSAWRLGRWSGTELAVLLVGIVPAWVVAFAIGLGFWQPRSIDVNSVLFFVLGTLTVAWAVVGVSLVRAPRRHPVRIDHRPA